MASAATWRFPGPSVARSGRLRGTGESHANAIANWATSGSRFADWRSIIVPVNWFQSSKDLLAIIIATAAVVVSLVTVTMQRRQGQRAAFREIYTTLMSDDLHRGRWLIYEISKTHIIPKDEKDVRLIYRTLGVFNNMAMFARQKVVPLGWVLEVWHHPLRDMHDGADTIRQNVQVSPRASSWPELWILFERAQTYHSPLPCCPPDNSWRGRFRRLVAPSHWRRRRRAKTRSGAAG
jgi:hypothetical protein